MLKRGHALRSCAPQTTVGMLPSFLQQSAVKRTAPHLRVSRGRSAIQRSSYNVHVPVELAAENMSVLGAGAVRQFR